METGLFANQFDEIIKMMPHTNVHTLFVFKFKLSLALKQRLKLSVNLGLDCKKEISNDFQFLLLTMKRQEIPTRAILKLQPNQHLSSYQRSLKQSLM